MKSDHEELDALFADLEDLEEPADARTETDPDPLSALAAFDGVETQVQQIVDEVAAIESVTEAVSEPEPAAVTEPEPEPVAAVAEAEPSADPDPPPSVESEITAILESMPVIEEPTAGEPEPELEPEPQLEPEPRPEPQADSDDDVDTLLAGEFESVAQVLAGVFDNAAVVEGAASDASILGAVETPDPEPEPDSAPEVTVAAKPKVTLGAKPKVTLGAKPKVTLGAKPKVTLGAKPKVTLAAPKTPVVEAPAAETPAEESETNAELEPVEIETERQGPLRIPAALWSRVEPPIVQTLSMISYPMRLLPSSLRYVMDWVALSLIFWVPIVWAIALFVV